MHSLVSNKQVAQAFLIGTLKSILSSLLCKLIESNNTSSITNIVLTCSHINASILFIFPLYDFASKKATKKISAVKTSWIKRLQNIFFLFSLIHLKIWIHEFAFIKTSMGFCGFNRSKPKYLLIFTNLYRCEHANTETVWLDDDFIIEQIL